jgi:hypothetical protein
LVAVEHSTTKVESCFGEEDADEWFSQRAEKRRLSRQTAATTDEEAPLAPPSDTPTAQQKPERSTTESAGAGESHNNWRASAAAQPVSFFGFGDRPTNEWKASPPLATTVMADAAAATVDSATLGRPDRPACASDDPRSPLISEEPAPFPHATFSASQLYSGLEPVNASNLCARESRGSGSVSEEAFCTPFLARTQPASRVATRSNYASDGAPAAQRSVSVAWVRKTGFLRIGAAGGLESLRAQPTPSVFKVQHVNHLGLHLSRSVASWSMVCNRSTS